MHSALPQPSRLAPLGRLWTWWRLGSLPILPPLIGFTATTLEDDHVLAQIAGLSLAEVRTRRSQGHYPYVARIGATMVGYGWLAVHTAAFGSPPVPFTIPACARYLWDFATLPAWRGQGVYPHLLQEIVRREASDVVQFWILHKWANQASARGIAKAGFREVGHICLMPGGELSLRPSEEPSRAASGAALLGLPLLVNRSLNEP